MKKTLLAEVLAIALLFCINNKTFMKKYIIIYALLLFSFVHTNAQSWLLTGNSGTKATNFLGTTDDKALVFRTNNMKTPAGRARKIAALVAMLARGETIVPESGRRRTSS